MAVEPKIIFTPCCDGDTILEFNGTGLGTWWSDIIQGSVWTYTPNPEEGGKCYVITYISVPLGTAPPNPVPTNDEMEYLGVDCDECVCTCYILTDCSGELSPIYTGIDLSGNLGQVITLADSTNHEIKGCWLVSESVDCDTTIDIVVYKCYDDCATCLPTPLPPVVPCPRPVNPGYETGLCDPEIVENVKCSYATDKYEKMMSRRFDVEYCCPKDEDELFIKYEKIRLKLLTSTDPTPDPCNPKCLVYTITVAPTSSAITSYLDCNEVTKQIITPLGEVATILRFCALDTQPPNSSITNALDVTTTYILESLGDCDITE
jgi:hypothetical protein